MLRTARIGAVVMGLFTITLVLFNGCKQQPAPVAEPAAFQEIVKDMQTLFAIQPATQKLLVIDPVKGDSLNGFEAKVTGNGLVLTDALVKADSLKKLLVAKGWAVDTLCTADGPQGSFAGFRQGNDLCIVSSEWAPADSVTVPQDQPLLKENLTPEQIIYTVVVQYAAGVVKEAAAVVADVAADTTAAAK
jgi:hypothetical protein